MMWLVRAALELLMLEQERWTAAAPCVRLRVLGRFQAPTRMAGSDPDEVNNKLVETRFGQ